MKRILKTIRPYLAAALITLTLSSSDSFAAGIATHSSSGETAVELFDKLDQKPYSSHFSAPEGWMLAEPSKLPKTTEMMVIGKGKGMFPPSINLGTEDFNGSVQDYLKIVKEICQTQGFEYKNLGTIETASGKARYIQTDSKGEWGQIRMIHLFLLKDCVMHIMTAGCLKDEFSMHRDTFIKALRSLKVNGSAYSMVKDPAKRKELQASHEAIKTEKQAEISEAFPLSSDESRGGA